MIEYFESPPENFKHQLECSAIYVVYKDTYLFLETNSHKVLADQWGVPAGKHELNETPLQAAARELHEEAGILVKEEELLSMGALYFKKPDIAFIYHTYFIQFSDLPIVYLSDEHKNFKWITIEEAKTLRLIDGALEALNFIVKNQKLIDFKR